MSIIFEVFKLHAFHKSKRILLACTCAYCCTSSSDPPSQGVRATRGVVYSVSHESVSVPTKTLLLRDPPGSVLGIDYSSTQRWNAQYSLQAYALSREVDRYRLFSPQSSM